MAGLSLDKRHSRNHEAGRWRRFFASWTIGLLCLVGVITVAVAAGAVWYGQNLRPVSPMSARLVNLEIKSEQSLSEVAANLKSLGVIRDESTFRIYVYLHGQQAALKAGTCRLGESESVPSIVDKIVAGCHDFKVVTFYPGATLESSLYAKTQAEANDRPFKDFSVKASLEQAGFTPDQITEALQAKYSGSLFAGRPAGASLEGYVFGETYYIDSDATAEKALEVAFNEMQQYMTSQDLVAKYQIQGLDLFQGITLASIVERELSCDAKPTEARRQTCYSYQQEIAQVFYNRLKLGMPLGSDVTFIYAADRLGIKPSPSISSPYNTRIVTGLPPGPIATPGRLALKAVANPTPSDNIYFLAGDDGLIYFAKTLAGHEANIHNHCQVLCGDL